MRIIFLVKFNHFIVSHQLVLFLISGINFMTLNLTWHVGANLPFLVRGVLPEQIVSGAVPH